MASVFDADGRAALRGPGAHAEAAEAADGAVAVAPATSQDDPFYALNLGIAGNAQAMVGVCTGTGGLSARGSRCSPKPARPPQPFGASAADAEPAQLGAVDAYDLTRDAATSTT